MKKLSSFDLTMIIIAVVIGLAGGGAWYYLSSQLEAVQQDVSSAADEFKKYSSGEIYLPTAANRKVLEANIELLKGQIDPLVQAKLQPANSKLSAITDKDTVAWKHDLDDEALSLNTAARLHAVNVPDNFYYGFSRYLNTDPAEEKTGVLSKQLLAVHEMATILINAPVKSIETVRRTYEEDPPIAPNAQGGGGAARALSDANAYPGNAIESQGGVYTDYPFEIEFEATTDSLRKVVDDLMQSPYVFVIRSLTIQNSKTDSPQVSALDQLAAAPTGSVGDNSPGAVAANTTSKGPQFLFGGETLHIKARIDFIEWKGNYTESAQNSGQGRRSRSNPVPNGGN